MSACRDSGPHSVCRPHCVAAPAASSSRSLAVLSRHTLRSRCLFLLMALLLREATAMSAIQRRTCWLAGPIQVLRKVSLLAFACAARRCCSALRACPRTRAAGSDPQFLRRGGAGCGRRVLYLSHLIQLPCLRLGQRGPVAELIASRLLGVGPAPLRLCCLFFLS